MESDQSNKRQRREIADEEAAEGAPRGSRLEGRIRRDEADFDVGVSWKAVVLRLGEKAPEFEGRPEPRDQIEFAEGVIKRNFDGIKGDLLPMLMQCMEEIPHKAPYYCTLVGLLNCSFESLGRAVVDHVYSGLQAGLDTGECHKVRILLRILTLLMCNNVVTPAAVLAAYTDLLSAALSASLDPTAGRDAGMGEGEEEDDSDHTPRWPAVSPEQPRADFLVFSVLAALPFGAQDLEKEAQSELEQVLTAAQDYLAARVPLRLPALSPLAPPPDAPPPQDFLEDLWGRVTALREDSWKAAAVPCPQEAFQGRLFGQEPRQHAGTPLSVPPTAEGSTPSTAVPRGRAFFAALQAYPPRLTLFKLFPAAKTDEAMAPIDRFIVQEYIVDILLYLNGCRKECTGYLVGLPVPFRYEYVMAETIFSQVLLLPHPPFPHVYYTLVLIDLCKALPGAFPAVLASAVRLLFSRMPTMDVECRGRVVKWMAHHLSNFAFVWPWDAWAAVARQPEWSPQRMFAAEVIEKEVRLAYHEKVKESLHSEAMAELLPPPAKPQFLYGKARRQQAEEGSTAKEGEAATQEGSEAKANGAHAAEASEGQGQGQGGPAKGEGQEKEQEATEQERALAQALIDRVRRKTLAREMVAWVEAELLGAPGVERARALDIAVQTLLMLGSKSITHASSLLERYCHALQKLAPDQASQTLLVGSVVRLWDASPHMASVLVDRCMALRIVSNLAIVDWVFLPQNYNLFHSSDRVWEILRNAVAKTANRVQDLLREVAGLRRTAAEASAISRRARAEAEEAASVVTGLDGPGQAEAASKVAQAQVEASRAEEDATSAEEALEAKGALLRRAEAEQEALFSSLFTHFSGAVGRRLIGPEGADEEMAEDNNPEEERRSKGHGRKKRSRLEEVEEKEWLRCTLGILRALCRQYAQQIWQMMESLQASLLPGLREDVLASIEDGLLLPKEANRL